VITARDLRARLDLTVGRLSVLDIAAAAFLSAWAAGDTSGVLHTSAPHGGAGASIGVLAMTLPVAWRRRATLAAAAVLAIAAVVNGLLFGPMVRCGPALPALFLVVFAAGSRCGRGRSATGLLLCAAGVVGEALYDPRIGARGLVVVLPVLAAFFAAGRLVRARTEAAEALRLRSVDVRRQREQTAHLAVMADRARLTADLESSLRTQISGIANAAAAGLQVAGDDLAAARQALAAIERDGRDLLGHMRDVLGTLGEQPPTGPQPGLAQLSELLAGATTADARLTVDGSPRALPAGLELSGYRIVEHLLLALEDAPGAVVDVLLRFCPDVLELQVSGPPAAGADMRAVLAAARERASLHGGTVDTRLVGGMCYAMARIPLISGYA
jgi:signal transduction histidine kinase